MTRKCEWKECPNPALWAPKINVPFVGAVFGRDEIFGMVLGVACCESCFAEQNVRDFLMLDHPKGMWSIFTIMEKRGAPDFNKAYLTKVSLTSNEMKMLDQGKPA